MVNHVNSSLEKVNIPMLSQAVAPSLSQGMENSICYVARIHQLTRKQVMNSHTELHIVHEHASLLFNYGVQEQILSASLTNFY